MNEGEELAELPKLRFLLLLQGKVSDIRKQQEVCCFQIFADNLCRVVCDESSAENRQDVKKERKFEG